MDTSIEIRRLLITAARELSARDGGAATRAHLIGAFGGLGAILRQEFDRAMAHGPEHLDDDGELLAAQAAESKDIAQPATSAKAAKTPRAKKKDIPA
ncbi:MULTISPECIES: hypothetical protein [unclassified Rhizobium]|uniref:hypothetical protein n=1 Tax=unclassified Rhizobium TaxID=2613769 RepID=UPI00160B24D9|nr:MULTISPECIES: hypothetical protein [unclassified Rhizobium]MBB3297893.1 hypothetical protein [Rhizobium sp. BK112]MBB4177612.1 hypothetical protein [Rhizobium sp. BK109]